MGTALYLTNGAGVLTKVNGLLNVNRPNLTVETVDTTTHDSADGIREFIAALADPGELSATIHYEPGSATDDLLLEHLVSREKRAFNIVTKGPAGALEDNEGMVILTSYEPDDAPIDGVRQATITGKVSGAVEQAAQPEEP
ncbi:hypothetical protein NX02_21900 [Sphingomonas sanxanigenens DSM 19645 = NX02]|uniref:Lambda phage tail tube protein N-terminal domain-containing protein n=1 Tax=Sphingomonas sanxanigenens DSM 19645 = NX02 TaxID=1123269 RepID=W0AK35_9SPHN|nr:hypothetical protein NX02_21390 [Sphingomonas sanxanigenens DSM 19645 = NX02]AHE56010.1 hypothetical protein NX02_21900 [Sphingomonas sanxanigenens DSM 19645 = NX02]